MNIPVPSDGFEITNAKGCSKAVRKGIKQAIGMGVSQEHIDQVINDLSQNYSKTELHFHSLTSYKPSDNKDFKVRPFTYSITLIGKLRVVFSFDNGKRNPETYSPETIELIDVTDYH